MSHKTEAIEKIAIGLKYGLEIVVLSQEKMKLLSFSYFVMNKSRSMAAGFVTNLM